jgi:hypothetical protein
MKKFYTFSHGANPAARRVALDRLIVEALSVGSRQAALALPSKNNIENYDDLFSVEQIRSFKRGGRAAIRGVDVHLWARRGNAALPVEGPVLVLDGSLDLVSAVQGEADVVIYVPWTEIERDNYISRNPDATSIYSPIV